MKKFFFFIAVLATIFFSNCRSSESIEPVFSDVEVVFEFLICCSDIWTTDSRLEEYQLHGSDKIIFDSGIEKVAAENNLLLNSGDRFLIDLEISNEPNCEAICDTVTGQHISILKIEKL